MFGLIDSLIVSLIVMGLIAGAFARRLIPGKQDLSVPAHHSHRHRSDRSSTDSWATRLSARTTPVVSSSHLPSSPQSSPQSVPSSCCCCGPVSSNGDQPLTPDPRKDVLQMWMLLSSRLRTWLALAVALPLVRSLIRRLAADAARRSPDAASTKLLHRTDATLSALGQRRTGRRARFGRRSNNADSSHDQYGPAGK